MSHNQYENQNESYITITENSILETKASLNETLNINSNLNSDVNFLLEEYEKISESFYDLNNE
jgi:hypothetical protein